MPEICERTEETVLNPYSALELQFERKGRLKRPEAGRLGAGLPLIVAIKPSRLRRARRIERERQTRNVLV